MSISPKNTLLFVHINTHFKEIIRVARLLKKDGNYYPVVFFMSKYKGWDNDLTKCQLEGIEYITYFDSNSSPANQSTQSTLRFKSLSRINQAKFLLKLIINKLLYFIATIIKKLSYFITAFKNSLIFIVTTFISMFNPETCSIFLVNSYKIIWEKAPNLLPGLSKAAHEFYKTLPVILKEKDIKLIVFPEHNLFYFTQLLAFIGKGYEIPSIIVPYTIANTMEWSEAFYNEPSRTLNNRLNRIFVYAFPHWVNKYKERLLLLPIELLLIHEMFGITPKNPWLLNSGNIDFLASESEAMNNYYISAGIEKTCLRATGALYNDELYFRQLNLENNKADLYRSLNLKSNKPMVLCALPPNQFSGREDLIEFKDYEESIRCILSELAQYSDNYHIVLSLHPRIIPDSVNFITEYPVKIFSGDVAEVIALCSVYVATCSATIRMAATCAIPVINYDLYRYRYDDYTNLKGVLTLFNRTEFSSTLNNLLTKADYYAYVCDLQKKQSAQWGLLDGKAGQKLLNEINLLFVDKS